jgi:hypothetical protein
VVRQAAEVAGLPYREHNYLQLRRGPYVIAACLQESVNEVPLELKGLFVDIYDANLPVLNRVMLQPGQQAWLLDLNRLDLDKAEPVASAGRFEAWTQTDHGVEFVLCAPEGVRIVSRIRLPKHPTSIMSGDRELSKYQWHQESHTVCFESPTGVSRQRITIHW